MRTERRATRLGIALLALLVAAACGSQEAPAPPPPEVLVVQATSQDVAEISEWLGTTQGFVDAEIRAQVVGYLISRDFQEGSRVEKGTLLFRIDPRPFRAALDQASGELRRAQAALERSRLDVARYRPLVAEGAVSQQEFDNSVQRELADRASVESAQAAAERARLELEFTEIRAPITGVVGEAQRQLGDFVGPSDPKPVTTISQIDPIQVEFPVSEREYLKLAPAFQAAVVRGQFRDDGLELVLADGTIFPQRGTAFPAGREIDPRTGTISVKGVFPNPEQLLRPGQYARIRAETGMLRGAVVVPQRAIHEMQGLGQVAVVGDDDTVDVRTVQLGATWGTLRVLSQGVAAGERVVVEGFQKVRPGMTVVAKPAPPEIAGAPPLPPTAAPGPSAEAPPPAQASGLPTAEAPPDIVPPSAPPPARPPER